VSGRDPLLPARRRPWASAIRAAGRLLLIATLAMGIGPLALGAAASGAPATPCRLPPTQRITAVPWAQRRLDLARVWPITEGAGVVVGIVDTGVQATHPMLAGRVLPGVDVINGGGTAQTDCQGHGTFVAGIAAAGHTPGVGFAGVAPAATILPIRQANDATDGTDQSLAAAIVAAVDHGAWVINVSIAVAASTPSLAGAVQYAQLHDTLVVAAAGNDAQQGDAAQYPAAYPGVLAVGAIGADGKPTRFSGTHSGVAVVAPGADILGPGAGGDGLVAAQEGTSFSTPFVSGVAALIHAYRPHLTAEQVRRRIEVTADHPAARLPDPQLGWGVINPYRAVTAVLPEERGLAAQTAPAPRLPAPGVPRVVRSDSGRAVVAAVALVLAAALIAIGSVIAVRGRRRGWRPAERGAALAAAGATPASRGGSRTRSSAGGSP
jgi:membrane-anchored mycosin MYCP